MVACPAGGGLVRQSGTHSRTSASFRKKNSHANSSLLFVPPVRGCMHEWKKCLNQRGGTCEASLTGGANPKVSCFRFFLIVPWTFAGIPLQAFSWWAQTKKTRRRTNLPKHAKIDGTAEVGGGKLREWLRNFRQLKARPYGCMKHRWWAKDTWILGHQTQTAHVFQSPSQTLKIEALQTWSGEGHHQEPRF